MYFGKTLNIQDPNIATNSLIAKIQNLIKNAHVKPKHNNRKFKQRKNWITIGIMKSCRTKEKLYNKWKKHKDNIELKTKYNTYCKKLDKVIKIAKCNYESNSINSKSNCSKDLWNYVNHKLGKNVKASKDIDYLIEHDVKITNSAEIADTFVNFFSNVGIDLAAKMKKTDNSTVYNIENNAKSIFFKPTDEQEIEKVIRNLKDKAGGVDGINTKVLKIISKFISKPLEFIFNNCMTIGIWPNGLKCAEILPIHKSGDKYKTNNYRPISLISNIAKVFEKIIHKRIYNFITDSKIIAKNQYGFLKNKGTKDAIVAITSFIYTNIDKNNSTVIAFLDLAKAFDTVDHALLLDKLYRYGIRGIAVDLIRDYLKNRYQVVKVNGVKSKSCKVQIGVPQGTILGPLLFLLYVNDIFKELPENCLAAYADDTIVKCIGKSWAEAESQMNVQLSLIGNWMCNNYLTLNVGKTNYITFGSYKDSIPESFELKIYDKTIKRTDNSKYLGVYFDSHMRWDIHIKEVIKKTRYFLFIFSKFKNIMNKKALKTIYYALFDSIVNYGIIAWGGSYKNVTKLLIKIQDKLINHLCDKNERTPVLGIKKKFISESLCYHYSDCREVFNEYKGKARAKPLQLPKINKNISYKDSKYIAIKYYNMLPLSLKLLNIKNKASKKKITEWIVDTDI